MLRTQRHQRRWSGLERDRGRLRYQHLELTTTGRGLAENLIREQTITALRTIVRKLDAAVESNEWVSKPFAFSGWPRTLAPE
ncbi:hypothetical protein [Paractinoplanes atraurantiacus]|uniref:Uncharacterized protein n=1 Tax=Paractinoplanes atraurantiacus TaxID=1036182 RepID=A0A285KFE6_9ACTN|nr:hypothetical protein [Actinoplanes atraurantiacus]SNY70146.1 hypothetical protein SAMN05421748_13726 [Actinoplanes atraurantiacus]